LGAVNKFAVLLLVMVQAPAADASTSRPIVAHQEALILEEATTNLSVDIGRLPSPEEWPGILFASPPGEKNWRGPYLRNMPKDPWDQPFVYVPHSVGKSRFGIYSVGANGLDEKGEKDDVSSWAGYDIEAYYPGTLRNRALALAALFVVICSLIYGGFVVVRKIWRRFAGTQPVAPADGPAFGAPDGASRRSSPRGADAPSRRG